jgi:HEAT repeat protein
LGFRALKKEILKIFKEQDAEAGLDKLCRMEGRRAVNPFFSLFHDRDEEIRWQAVSAMGAVVANMAETDIESARNVMRRLIWNLNDESGGIGWGSPEAMGEIMARHGQLAEEYAFLLAAYIDCEKNFVEHEILQRGVLWGTGRLAHVRPNLLNHAVPLLVPFLRSGDPYHRGFAAWAAGALNPGQARHELERLAADNTTITIFLNHRLEERTVAEIAKEASKKYQNPPKYDGG